MLRKMSKLLFLYADDIKFKKFLCLIHRFLFVFSIIGIIMSSTYFDRNSLVTSSTDKDHLDYVNNYNSSCTKDDIGIAAGKPIFICVLILVALTKNFNFIVAIIHVFFLSLQIFILFVVKITGLVSYFHTIVYNHGLLVLWYFIFLILYIILLFIYILILRKNSIYGNSYAQNNIKREKLSIESPYPPIRAEVFNKENSQLTDDELVSLKDHALRGGKNEAYKLFEYHRDYKHDEKPAYYWLRIAAQNYDVRSQYEYGKYLLASNDEYEKIRGGFWIRKAATNGNAEAKKLEETLWSETQ